MNRPRLTAAFNSEGDYSVHWFKVRNINLLTFLCTESICVLSDEDVCSYVAEMSRHVHCMEAALAQCPSQFGCILKDNIQR